MKVSSIFLILIFISCGNIKKNELDRYKTIETTNYFKHNPLPIEGFELKGYDIAYAYKLDSVIILSAYFEGDIGTSVIPINWGDRLISYKNNTINFQSEPVGDVYLYEPHFYKNDVNQKTIIICQLGYEYYFGGEVFILENGTVEFLGTIEFEDIESNSKVTDIVQISEDQNSINFQFQSDSLIFKPDSENIIIKNTNIYYSYKEQKWQLNGLDK